jgi:glutamate racemase
VIEPGVDASVRATFRQSRRCPLFVHLVEEDLISVPESELVARHSLADMPDVDTLVLGRTHYPMLAPMLARLPGGDAR